MRRDQLIGAWRLTAWGPLPVNYTSVLTLFDDGYATVATAMENGFSSTDQATWQYVDDTHWNLSLQIQPDPKIPGLEDGAIDVLMSLEKIKSAIPHRDPFLLIDAIVEQSDNRIVCRKRFTGEEFWYRGHYPEFPLTPGVLLLESAMQAGAVLLAKVVADNPDKVPVVSRINNVKFKAMVRPGDTVTLDVTLKEQLAGAFFMDADVLLDGKTAVTFEFACKMAGRTANMR